MRDDIKSSICYQVALDCMLLDDFEDALKYSLQCSDSIGFTALAVDEQAKLYFQIATLYDANCSIDEVYYKYECLTECPKTLWHNHTSGEC